MWAAVTEAQWFHFLGGHGDGMCDAQGGRTSSWLDQAATRKVISCDVEMTSALNEAAGKFSDPQQRREVSTLRFILLRKLRGGGRRYVPSN